LILHFLIGEAKPCGDPRCENGTIVGDEYVTRDGEVDNHTWDCSECQANPDDSMLVSAAQITAIRETVNDLIVYLVGGTQIRVRFNDYNRSAVTLWQIYVEGGQK
jgi:hypothetical protein